MPSALIFLILGGSNVAVFALETVAAPRGGSLGAQAASVSDTEISADRVFKVILNFMEIQMNKKINLAVASATLVLGATAANAGIVIPAGEWTLDVNGNVNVYATAHQGDDTKAANSITGGLATYKDTNGESDSQGINTGLLPACR